MGNLLSCATSSSKSSINQDYCLTVHNETLKFSGVIVADGIGSHFKSEISSKFCCERLKELLEKTESIDEIDFERLFKEVTLALIDFAKNTNEFDFNAIDKNLSLGTTLICALDFAEEYVLAYVGNGCIWHIDGRFNQFGKNFYLPWNSVNLLNPHSIEQDGKAALYRYISVSDRQYRPTVIRLAKNQFLPGELIVIATDGVFSNDAVPIGKDGNGTVWIKGEETMSILYSYLSAFLSTNPIDAGNENLGLVLNQYLNELKEKGVMHDDTTLGVIISDRAIEYHQELYDKKVTAENQNEESPNQ